MHLHMVGSENVFYFKLLKLKDIMKAMCYQQKIVNLNQALKDKPAEYAKRLDKEILN